MKKIVASLFFLCIIAVSYAQVDTVIQDSEASRILKKVSAKTKKYKTVRVKFDYKIENKTENYLTESKGVLFLKGEKYKLFLLGNEIMYNGKTLATYMVEEEEITISEPEYNDDNNFNPARMLNFYEKNFKFKYLGEYKKDGGKYAEINLFPMKASDKRYIRVNVSIALSTNQFSEIKYFSRDGTEVTITPKEIATNIKIVDSIFLFDEKKYSNIEIVDLRE